MAYFLSEAPTAKGLVVREGDRDATVYHQTSAGVGEGEDNMLIGIDLRSVIIGRV